MHSAASKLDHPLITVATTLALSALFLLIALQLEARDIGPAFIVMPFTVFAAGGVLFAIYGSAAARWSRAVDPLDSMFIVAFGLSFTLWGMMTLPMCGGVFGVLHAIACTAGIRILIADWRPACAPLPALAAAWLVTWIARERGWPPGELTWMLIPILTWNIQMSLVFAGWSAWRRRHPLPDALRFCPACGYDLMGLRQPVCPECGASVHLPQAAAPGGAEPR